MASTSCCRQSPSPPNYVSIKVQRKGGGVVVDWYAIDCGQGDVTFAQLYEKLVAASEFRPVNFRDILSRTASAQFFCNEGRVGRGVEVYAGLQVGHACRQFGYFVRIEVDKTAASEGAEVPRPKSAFEVMMMASREKSRETFMFPAYAGTGDTENNNPLGHIRLYNNIVDILKKHNFRFERNKGNEVSSKEVLVAIRNAVWYVLPHLRTLADRAIYLPQELRSLYDGKTFTQTYNNPSLHRHTLKPMSGKELTGHAQELFKVCCVPLLQKPHLKRIKDMVVNLGEGISKYSEHLETSNWKVQEQRKQLFPVRSVQDGHSSELRVIEAKVRHDPKIIERYSQLEKHLAVTEEYKVCFLNDFAPTDYRKRYTYISELQLPMSIELYTYKTGNNLGSLHFIWKVPPSKESRDLNQSNRLMHEVEKNVPVYHTREMHKKFSDRFTLVTSATPVVLREMYQYLTNDATVEECPLSKDIRQRLKMLLDSEDPDLIVDMRSLNERKESYQEFWNEAAKVIEEMQLRSVDDRRHGQVCYMALVMSIQDFITQVAKRLPEGAKIPSPSWVSLQFWPKNPYADRAVRYTGRLGIKYMVQSRQLNHDHPDCHYAAAVFKYLKEFAVMFRDFTAFVCLDDKHSIKVGEPGYPLAAVDRGKSVLVAQDTVFVVADHDFAKVKLVPSVTLVCEVPESASESFYRGKVFVSLKDATFQPSSPIRHQTELFHILTQAGKLGLPILCQYSDGGPDHRLTYISTQVSLICMFIMADLDMLVCARTAPQNSFRNPVERVMSIINLSLQAIGVMREKMPPAVEKLFAGLGTMKDVRAMADKHPELKQALVASTEKTRAMMNELFQRLSLKGEAVSTIEPATDQEVEEMWELILMVDQTLTKGDTTKVKVQNKKDLMAFMHHCCVSRHYSFSIKKCGDSACTICKKPKLPPEVFNQLKNFPDPVADGTGEHYRPFIEVYGTATSEGYRPSLKDSRAKDHGMPFSPCAENTRGVLACLDCGKPRTIHSQRALTAVQKKDLDSLKEDSMYTCGVCWVPEDHPLREICYVSRALSCDRPVEQYYYSTRLKAPAALRAILPLVCWQCGAEETLPIPVEKMQQFQSVHPVCQVCKSAGVMERTRGRKKMKRRREEEDGN
ncbi:hypothetical protein Bbelb_049330 [Branchiostoma belcheri]|nr:hypothetical protein Bbelb_049330 [Branchiostoma belcheri]